MQPLILPKGAPTEGTIDTLVRSSGTEVSHVHDGKGHFPAIAMQHLGLYLLANRRLDWDTARQELSIWGDNHPTWEDELHEVWKTLAALADASTTPHLSLT